MVSFIEWVIPVEIRIASMLFHMIYDPICAALEFLFSSLFQTSSKKAFLHTTYKTLVYHDDLWQTPVITEKKIRELLSDIDVTSVKLNSKNGKDKNVTATFIAFPWATLIDLMSQKVRKEEEQMMINTLHDLINSTQSNAIGDTESNNTEIRFTVCQHIYFQNLIELWKGMNITHVFTPHARKGVDFIDGVQIHAIPLYPVHAPEPQNKELLFSFIGAYDPTVYMSDVRSKIFDNFAGTKGSIVERTPEWHFQKDVYNRQVYGAEISKDEEIRLQDAKEKYLDVLSKSRFSLCPSGSGPNSIRLWESLRAGAIPIVLSDTLRLPLESFMPQLWEQSVLRVQESDVASIPDILADISIEDEEMLRKNGMSLFHQLCGVDGVNMHKTILKQFQHVFSQD